MKNEESIVNEDSFILHFSFKRILHLRGFFIYLESELQLHVGHIVILTL